MTPSDHTAGRGGAARWPLVRLAIYAVAFVATAAVATIATRLLVPPAPSPLHDLVWIKNLSLPLLLFGIYAGLVAVLEHRRATEVAPRIGTFALGVMIGAGLIGAAVFTLSRLGTVEMTRGTGLDGVALALAMPLVTAMAEELLFRVILFGILEEIAGSFVAIVLSAAAFGLAHAGNPGATPFSLFALSVELGVMLSLAYMLTRNVWIVVGIHAGWNFMQSFVFGAANSGTHDPFSYFRTTLSGPDILTGGAFGLEGSSVSLGLCVIVSAALLALAVRKGRWIGFRLRLSGAATA